jgi:hypothetical protein
MCNVNLKLIKIYLYPFSDIGMNSYMFLREWNLSAMQQ